MREQEMRLRVFRFLKARMRNMIMPATVGLGLAVGGCAKESVTPVYSAAIPDSAVPIYSAVLPDGSSQKLDVPPGPDQALADVAREAGPEAVSSDVSDASPDVSPPDMRKADGITDFDAPRLPDLAVALDGGGIDGSKSDGVAPIDTGADLGGMKYIAPIPDGSIDALVTKYIAPIPDGAVALYMAQTPDGGALDGLAVRYMAQIPDASVAAPLYMAPPPQQS